MHTTPESITQLWRLSLSRRMRWGLRDMHLIHGGAEEVIRILGTWYLGTRGKVVRYRQ